MNIFTLSYLNQNRPSKICYLVLLFLAILKMPAYRFASFLCKTIVYRHQPTIRIIRHCLLEKEWRPLRLYCIRTCQDIRNPSLEEKQKWIFFFHSSSETRFAKIDRPTYNEIWSRFAEIHSKLTYWRRRPATRITYDTSLLFFTFFRLFS